jgi:hypothetical protein
MSHYAKVVDGVVTQVIVAEADFFETFVDTSPGEWIQTSYNTTGGQHPEGRPLRKNYAGIGYSYDRQRDAFIPPKPFPSWSLNEDTCLWEPPSPRPTSDGFYNWDEANQVWVLSTTTGTDIPDLGSITTTPLGGFGSGNPGDTCAIEVTAGNDSVVGGADSITGGV